MKELTNSLKAVLYSRVSSPIYSTFILAWCVYNWKAVLTLLFSEDKVADRITAVESMLSSNGSFDWCTLIVPVLTTIIFLAAKPAAESALFVLSARLKAWAEDRRDNYNKHRRLTLEQSQAYADEMNRSIERFNDFFAAQNAAKAESDRQADELNEKIRKVQQSLSSTEKERNQAVEELQSYKVKSAKQEGVLNAVCGLQTSILTGEISVFKERYQYLMDNATSDTDRELAFYMAVIALATPDATNNQLVKFYFDFVADIPEKHWDRVAIIFAYRIVRDNPTYSSLDRYGSWVQEIERIYHAKY
ncbi:DUF4200 domain-containing protein [Oceanospirillum linum]|uniref:Uncharacterized protein n=1 Tax=Oceanospirillum linum TaxID=966 RepID=A0A1T1HE05_OCELI|nr:DUF4200 domain-containing protein [Oceanospirillum linum]OOV88098.1 hypothetical protein BTA35_0200655 [Oceanospirillum linum]SEF43089.1 hypothetical protein SAMN04489856_101132 [Oleiphilus messinensis]SMP01242.1 hypothetical protein SAMN06264348_101133 [Oceanospirillum linum]